MQVARIPGTEDWKAKHQRSEGDSSLPTCGDEDLTLFFQTSFTNEKAHEPRDQAMTEMPTVRCL